MGDVVRSDSVEAQFARRLAGNEKHIRDRALKKLKLFISLRSARPDGGFTRVEMLSIWKGLFYCMWMSDKPLVQEELANKISDLIIGLTNSKTAMLFFDVFLETIQREWKGIDRLRMDKFYLLVRSMLEKGFRYLESTDWDEGLIDWMLAILKNGPICPTNPVMGLHYHMCDIYLEELGKVAEDALPSEKVLKFLDPYCILLTRAKNFDLTKSVIDEIFQQLVENSKPALDLLAEEDEMDSQTESEIPPIANLKVDYKALAERIYELASEDGVLSRNRKKAFALVEKFRELYEGRLPLADVPDAEYSSGDEIETLEGDLTKKLLEQNSKEMEEKVEAKKQKRRKRKAKMVEDIQENEVTLKEELQEDEDTQSADESIDEPVAPTKKKKKRKKKKLEDVKEKTTESTNLEKSKINATKATGFITSEPAKKKSKDIGAKNLDGENISSTAQNQSSSGDNASSGSDLTKKRKKKKKTKKADSNLDQIIESSKELADVGKADATKKPASLPKKKKKIKKGAHAVTADQDGHLQDNLTSSVTEKIEEPVPVTKKKKQNKKNAVIITADQDSLSQDDPSFSATDKLGEPPSDCVKNPSTAPNIKKKRKKKSKSTSVIIGSNLSNQISDNDDNQVNESVLVLTEKSRNSKSAKNAQSQKNMPDIVQDVKKSKEKKKIFSHSGEKQSFKHLKEWLNSAPDKLPSDTHIVEKAVTPTEPDSLKLKKRKKNKMVEDEDEVELVNNSKVGSIAQVDRTPSILDDGDSGGGFTGKIRNITPKPTAATFVRFSASKLEKMKKNKHLAAIKRKSEGPISAHSPKRVVFEMSKTQVQRFRKTDKAITVSPKPNDIAFDPRKTPEFGLLKRSAHSTPLSERKSASDFF